MPKPRRLRRHELHAPSHDRRGYYAPSDLPKDAPIAAVDIDDPWPIRENAAERLTGVGEWLAPQPPKIRIVRSLRGDQIGRMHARHQIDDAQFHAGRAYQQLIEKAGITGHVRSVDLEAPVIDGTRQPTLPVTDATQGALTRLRRVDGELALQHGVETVVLVRAVLIETRSIEAVARACGAGTVREIRHVAWLFRRALDELAVLLGYANAPRRPRPVVDRRTFEALSIAARIAASAA